MIKEAIQWPVQEDNKLQIKYYDASVGKEENPLDFFMDLTSMQKDDVTKLGKDAAIFDTNGHLSFNKLALVENRFSQDQWNQLKLLLVHRFSETVKRVRLWDCSLDQAKVNSSGSLDHEVSFDNCITNIFNAVELKQGGLLELDL